MRQEKLGKQSTSESQTLKKGNRNERQGNADDEGSEPSKMKKRLKGSRNSPKKSNKLVMEEVLAPLSQFFSYIEKDPRISVTHIGIYASLLQFRKEKGFKNPIIAFSNEIMSIAKISSPATYLKCVRDLSDFGYIRYEPSFNKNKGSKIYFFESK